MTPADLVSTASVAAVFAYYVAAWLKAGRDPKRGAIVPQYEAPRNLSPAMLRYVWKQGFDERVFWAGILSLAAKGVIELNEEGGAAVVRRSEHYEERRGLPSEEAVVATALLEGRKRTALNMLDSKTTAAVARMYEKVRKAAAGKWFLDNEKYLQAGGVLSLIALCAAAWPQSLDDCAMIALCFGLMAPAAYHLPFATLRLADVYRASRHSVSFHLASNTLTLLFYFVGCVSGVSLGFVVMSFNFGARMMLSGIVLIVLNVAFAIWMKAPTKEGRKLLDEIEGFRTFLQAVDKFSLDRSEAPSPHAGMYEKYLPYAVALEVEQAWSDRFIALTSTIIRAESGTGGSSMHLGLWKGKPVDIAYVPQKRHGGC